MSPNQQINLDAVKCVLEDIKASADIDTWCVDRLLVHKAQQGIDAVDAIYLEAETELCVCKDRKKVNCPGEWEQGCDLGNKAEHAKVALLGIQSALSDIESVSRSLPDEAKELADSMKDMLAMVVNVTKQIREAVLLIDREEENTADALSNAAQASELLQRVLAEVGDTAEAERVIGAT